MITDIIIRRRHMTTRRATRYSLVIVSHEEALMIIVLFLRLQYFTVRAKHRSERKRRELARIREEDARA